MHVMSVNIGAGRRLEGRRTGIFKVPTARPVQIGALGLAGDVVCDKRHHGGEDQAVYLYRSEDYGWWSRQRGVELGPGTFGENITLSGLPSADLVIGSRLHFPQVVLEVSAPRIPCNTLAKRMEDSTFVKAFKAAERPGFYARVLQTGPIASGEDFRLEVPDGLRATTVELYRSWGRRMSLEELDHFLAAPIDIRTRTKLEADRARR